MVKLLPDVDAARDLSDSAMMGPSPQGELDALAQTLQTAQRVRDI